MLRNILATIVVLSSCAQLSDASCTAKNDCSACVDQAGGLFGSVSCSFCSSSGKCTTDMTATCSGQWVGHSSTCTSCVSSCPAPTPPPAPPCHLPTTRDPNACKDSDSCEKACDAVSCMGGSAWSSSGGSKTCECIPNPCTSYPGCGKTYCTAMEHAEDEKHAARRSMLEASVAANSSGPPSLVGCAHPSMPSNLPVTKGNIPAGGSNNWWQLGTCLFFNVTGPKACMNVQYTFTSLTDDTYWTKAMICDQDGSHCPDCGSGVGTTSDCASKGYSGNGDNTINVRLTNTKLLTPMMKIFFWNNNKIQDASIQVSAIDVTTC